MNDPKHSPGPMCTLDSDIGALPGVGAKRAAALESAQINRIKDLLFFYPRKYDDRRNITPLAQAPEGQRYVFCGCFSRVSVNIRISRAVLSDSTGSIKTVWFNRPHLAIKPDTPYVCWGTVSSFMDSPVLVNPIYQPKDTQNPKWGRIFPVYSPCSSISASVMGNLVQKALLIPCAEYLPHWILETRSIMEYERALKQLHGPDCEQSLSDARRSMAYREFLSLQARFAAIQSDAPLPPVKHALNYLEKFISRLPYQLTEGQNKILSDAAHSIEHGERIRCLLQGEVGSGKTAVALGVLNICTQNGQQGAYMAPTEILARQVYSTAEALGLPVCLLTGSLGAKDKNAALNRIASSEPIIAVGTHALCGKSVNFASLSCVVVDEQHRFGVEARNALVSKGQNPHLMVATATPIPRTMAMAMYGDLGIMQLHGTPPGRGPVITKALPIKEASKLMAYLKKELINGGKCYWVCPRLEEDEHMAGVLKRHQYLCTVLGQYNPELIHGSLKTQQIADSLNRFRDGSSSILVSTTVIEVGIDVPDATVMVIEHAERFGVSQLHQLRGRVGRSHKRGVCVLLHGECDTTRIDSLVRCRDGFELARIDMETRGSGHIFGTRQHGNGEFVCASLPEDIDLLKAAQHDTAKWKKTDPASLTKFVITSNYNKIFTE